MSEEKKKKGNSRFNTKIVFIFFEEKDVTFSKDWNK